MSTQTAFGHFVWHDCLTPNIDQALDFFSKLNGWTVLDQITPNVGRYPIIQNHGSPIAGILEMPAFLQSTGVPPYWTGYVYTDIKRAEAAIPSLGGQMFTMPTKSAMGTSFVFTDSGGAVLAAYEISESFKIPSSNRSNDIVWQRLYSKDHAKSAPFYEALFGWQRLETDQGVQTFSDDSGQLVGDMVGEAQWTEFDTWVYFIGVSSVDDAALTIEREAGSILETTQIQNRAAMIIKDSQGGVIGLVDH